MTNEHVFKTVWRSNADNWGKDGDIITDSDKLATIEKAFSDFKVLIIEHHYYRGSRSRDLVVLEDYESFIDYLKENAVAGDLIRVFDITTALKESNQLTSGKCPDQEGEIPKGGPY